MVVANLFPFSAVIILGALRKRIRFTSDHLPATSDRLIYSIYFPALLFWKLDG